MRMMKGRRMKMKLMAGGDCVAAGGYKTIIMISFLPVTETCEAGELLPVSLPTNCNIAPVSPTHSHSRPVYHDTSRVGFKYVNMV